MSTPTGSLGTSNAPEASAQTQPPTASTAPVTGTDSTTLPKGAQGTPSAFWVAVFGLMSLSNALQGDQVNNAMEIMFLAKQNHDLEEAKDNIPVPPLPNLNTGNQALDEFNEQHYESQVQIYNDGVKAIQQRQNMINVQMQGVQSRGNADQQNMASMSTEISSQIRTIANLCFHICNISMAMTNLPQFNMSTDAGASG